ncbi:MAG: hypothetical protein HWE27_17560 [Gammaproteobacteria bacterium]|nr:hypothetical protein [Gammaproteobacteria bacterium]
MEEFEASVQYNDFKGSVAADNADQVSATKWLMENGHLDIDTECVLGIEASVGEVHGQFNGQVSVSFFIGKQIEQGDVREEPIEVKRVSLSMAINEFIALFKRFNVCIAKEKAFDRKQYIEKEHIEIEG